MDSKSTFPTAIEYLKSHYDGRLSARIEQITDLIGEKQKELAQLKSELNHLDECSHELSGLLSPPISDGEGIEDFKDIEITMDGEELLVLDNSLLTQEEVDALLVIDPEFEEVFLNNESRVDQSDDHRYNNWLEAHKQ